MDNPDSTIRDLYREHVASLDVLRHARNVFFWLAVVAVALHLIAWIIVGYTHVLAPLAPATLSPRGGDHADQPSPTDEQLGAARRWEAAVQSALSLGGFVGRASTLVLAGLFTIALLVSLSGRLGGVADLTKACVWSLVALAMLVPWIRSPGDAAGAVSALVTLEELNLAVGQEGRSATGGFLSFVRFLACPGLVIVFLVLAQTSFRDAHRRITAVPSAKLPIHEV